MAEVVELLNGMGLAPRPLRSAGVVLVDLAPEQLRKVADWASVRAIHPNRTVR